MLLPTEPTAWILVHHGIMIGGPPVTSLAHLGLGRAYALQGGTARAKAVYRDFLTLCKDVDPDKPVLKQAKAEHAKLR